jgi:uncharacterized protein YigE (DUF2233 family)
MRWWTLALFCAACSRPSKGTQPQATSAEPQSAPACTDVPATTDLAPGLRLQTFRASSPPRSGAGDGCVTLVRIDPARFKMRLLNAATSGGPRTAPKWAQDFGLVGVVNAAMYAPDGRSVGLMVNGAFTSQAHDLPKMGGYFAFDRKRPDLPEVAVFGRGCDGFDLARVRADYGTVFQDYRLLDCDGRPIAWQDEKIFSVSAVGIDKDGRVVFAYAKTRWSMTEFARIVAADELGIAQMMHTEGGPEASLYVQAGDRTVATSAEYELPNVLGFSAR